jgi:hypothetical protein
MKRKTEMALVQCRLHNVGLLLVTLERIVQQHQGTRLLGNHLLWYWFPFPRDLS